MEANKIKQKELLQFFIKNYVDMAFEVDTGCKFGLDMIDEAVEKFNQNQNNSITEAICPECKKPIYIYFPLSKSYYCPNCDLMHRKETI